MDPGTRGAGVHWFGFTGDTLKLAKISVKLKFTEEAAKSIVEDVLYSKDYLNTRMTTCEIVFPKLP